MTEHITSPPAGRRRSKRVLTVLTVILVAFLMVIAGLFGLSLTAGPPSGLGVHDGRLARCPDSPNCVSSQSDDVAHWIEPLSFTGDPADVIPQLKQLISRMPRAVIVDESSTYLRVEFRSRLFRFVDDVEFLVEPETQRVHFRSASRVGRSDLGVNRARMEQIRKQFQQRSSI